MQDDPVRKLKVGGGEWDDSLRKIGHLRSKCYGRITRLIPFFRCAERYFQAFNCNSPGVSGGVSIPIMQPFQAELAYAWFVQAGKVTATGMEVTVESTGGLIISYCGEADAWGTIATAGMTEPKALKPASTNATLTEWTTAQATSAAASTINLSTVQPITSDIISDNKIVNDSAYHVMREFKIRATAQSNCKGLYVESVDVKQKGTQTDTAQNLSESLRVAVVTDSKKIIMAPVQKDGVQNHTLTTTFHSSAEDTAGTAVTAVRPGKDNVKLIGDTESVPASDGAAIHVQIVIWYEGEDGQLFTDNVLADENLSISVHFAAVSGAGTNG